nr:MAG TPA: acetyltransferase domain containing protein [Caudoviricetes sp.]
MKYFWQVKEMLPDTTVYVYEDNGSVQGFIGLTKS